MALDFVRAGALDDLRRKAATFASANPFPHLIIDEFLTAEAAAKVHDEARAAVANVDASNDLTQHRKVACTDWPAFGAMTSRLISFFNSAEFVGPLEQITGLDGLFGDPWLEGGGIHLTSTGGFLKMHTDFNWNAKLRADRRVNILYYLNRGWQAAWGGELAIARLGRENEPATVEPVFNRLVIFNTNDTTLHGHPSPHAFPPTYPRASIAMYYYTSGIPVPERTRRKATTTRYVPLAKGDIDLRSGSLRSRLGYLLRRFTGL